MVLPIPQCALKDGFGEPVMVCDMLEVEPCAFPSRVTFFADLYLVSISTRVTAVTNKRFWSLCQKYRWQVTVLQANSFSLIQWGWCGTSHSLKKHQNNYGPSWHLVHWQRHHSQAQVLSGCCKYRQSSVMCREMIVRCRKGVSLKSAQVHQFRTPNE